MADHCTVWSMDDAIRIGSPHGSPETPPRGLPLNSGSPRTGSPSSRRNSSPGSPRLMMKNYAENFTAAGLNPSVPSNPLVQHPLATNPLYGDPASLHEAVTVNQIVMKPRKPAPQTFVINFDDDEMIEDITTSSDVNLQEAFRRYKRERQNEYKNSIAGKPNKRLLMSDQDRMWRLRMRFLNQAKKYFGIPYARKYWSETDPEYASPIFLDCCALVRRVVRDLKLDFGFQIGPWNQSYQYDTLPIVIDKLEDVKPGDLVFIAATYNSTRCKKQRHNLTHVEIMLGDGTPRTIGARWQKGKVQIFDSYAFEAKSYHSPIYTFKSLDTWLMGECRSHCPQHEWLTRREKRLKRLKELKQKKRALVFENERSIFSRQSDDEENDDENDENYCANDTDDELVESVEDDRSLRAKISECLGQLENEGELERGELEEEEHEREEDLRLKMRAETELRSDGDDDVDLDDTMDLSRVLSEITGTPYVSVSTQPAPPVRQSFEVKRDVDLESLSSAVSSISIETNVTDQSENALPMTYYNVINAEGTFQPDVAYDVMEVSDENQNYDVIASGGYGHFMTSQYDMTSSRSLNTNFSARPDSAVTSCSCENADCCGHDFNIQLIDLTRQISCGPIETAVTDQGAECENQSEANQEAPKEKLTNQREGTIYVAPSEAKSTNQRAGEEKSANQRSGSILPAVTSTPMTLYPTERLCRTVTVVGSRRRDEIAVNNNNKPRTSTMPPDQPEGAKRSQSPVEKSGEGGDTASPKRQLKQRKSLVELANNQVPIYYIGGGNGNALIDGPLSKLGWKRTQEKTDDFRLKWTECKSNINYNIFKEGEQMVNHIPNGSAMTNKLGLYNSLKEYDRVLSNTRKRYCGILMKDFYPETYNLDDRPDREAFLDTYKDGEIWICKPTGMNQGKGIYLVRSLEEIKKILSAREERRESTQNQSRRLMGRIIQRYLPTPMLLEGKKFDVRTYMAITSTVPFMVFYHQGYCRLSCQAYCKDSEDLKIHLTNQYIQKRDPAYKDVKEDTVWSMERLNEYINTEVAPAKGLQQDWVNNVFVKQTQRIMLHLFKSVKNKLGTKVGFFELYGLDFMIDHDMKIYLIEVNVNPSLATNCEILREVIPPVVEETLALSIESFDKSRKNQPLLPLKNLRNFYCLYSENRHNAHTRGASPDRSEQRRASGAAASPQRWNRNSSPSKEQKAVAQSPFSRPLSLPKIPNQYQKVGTTTNPAVQSGPRRPVATKLVQLEPKKTSITGPPASSSSSEPVKLKMTTGEENTTAVTGANSSQKRKTAPTTSNDSNRGN